MTLNITVATPRFLISTTDRRLTNILTGGIISEQSTKLTQLVCRDAVSLITYNGVGKHQGQTPADWLLTLDREQNLTSLPLKDVVEAIREMADKRISALPKIQRRHTFVLGARQADRTLIIGISNYESVLNAETLSTPREHFEISVSTAAGNKVHATVSGSTQHADPEDLRKIGYVAKQPGAAGEDIKNLCVKMTRNIPLKMHGRGPVGSSVLWAIAERGAPAVQGGLDVLGGTTIETLPNLILPTIQIKDILIEPGSKSLMFGKPNPLPETKCKRCQNPIPTGYKKCGVCGLLITE